MDLDGISRSDASDFKIGDWWVRPQRNELERAEETAHIEARSMDVLVCLARHAPGVVGKERLVEEVWTDSPYIGDDAISHAIWELRKALGDSARDPVYIQTVPRKGYRLVAEILRPQGAAMPMAGVRIDHYDLGEELGRGSMGVVYEAVDRRLGRSVAIKFLAPELTRDLKACERFQREARLAASLDHPNLATVHEVGETSQGHRYLVNSFYRGGSLKDRLAAGPIAVDEALQWVRQLVAGLGAAHQRDVVHRDIKPANLLLDEHGTLKICDFGIAKLLGATDLTRTGAALGTPAYKSPEQAEGRAVDHRTDLWAVGVVLFELLTRRRPFEGEYEQAVVHSILSREPRAMEDAQGQPVPEPLRRFIGRALAKDPSCRFQSAEEMLLALDGLGEERMPVPRLPRLPRLRRAGWRRGWGVVVGCLVVLLVFESLWAYWTSEDPSQAVVQRHLQQGRNFWLRGNDSENLNLAQQQFLAALELMPQSLQTKGELAVFLAARFALFKEPADREEASRFIYEILAEAPRASLALSAQAKLLLYDSKLDEALEKALEKAELAIKAEPSCAYGESCDLAYLVAGEALYALGRTDEAIDALETGIHQGGGYIRCRLKLAQIYEKLRQPDDAEDQYRTVLALDHVQTAALNQAANFYVTQEQYRKALSLLDLSYRQNNDPRTMISIGNIYYQRELFEFAIDKYDEAQAGFEAAGEKVPTALMNKGDAYLEDEKEQDAREAYEAALEVFDSVESLGIKRLWQRAVCLAKLGRVLEAKQAIDALQTDVADFPDYIFYAARIYAIEGDDETLFRLARQSQQRGGSPSDFLDDVAFKPYRLNSDYLNIIDPTLKLGE